MTEERFIQILDDMLEEKLDRKLDEKLEEKLDKKLDEKLAGLKEDVAVLKEDVAGLKEDVSDLKVRVTSLEAGQVELKQDIAAVRLIVENDIKHPIALLCENLYPVSEGWIKNEKRLDKMESDIRNIKFIVQNHSRELRRLEKV